MKFSGLALFTSAFLLAATPVFADDDAQSRAYFETGAKAYEKGDYLNAIRAFEQAYALTKRPGLIFSIGQSYKRQYAVDSNPAHLRKSLEYYRRFLVEDKSGKRRGDATQAIMEVEAIIGRLPPDQQTPLTQPAEPPQPTQISVTTQVEEATVSIDDGPPRTLEPIEVKPGKHKVVLQAPGYFPEERELFAADKQMTAIDVPLRPIPAKVTLEGRSGATVLVDGVDRGTLPLLTPLEIDAGERTITVSHNGFVTYSREHNLGRGKELKLKVDLSRTPQRIASLLLLGTGIVIAGGGVLAALGSAGAYGEGQNINKDRLKEGGSITKERLDRYEELRVQQSNLIDLSTAGLSLGTATAGLGFLLYYFDVAKVPPVKRKQDDTSGPKKEKSPGLFDIVFTPVATPGFAGASFSAKF